MDRALNAHQRSDTISARTPLWPLVPCGLALLLVSLAVVRSGTWLDEYWQSWISGAPASALLHRLAADAHPPWFNLFARLILLLTGGAVIPARLLNLVAASSVLAFGLSGIRSLDSGLRWRIWLLIVASGGVLGMTDLAASFRSYSWLLVLAGLQSALLAAIALKRPVPALLAGAVTAASISIHYVHAAAGIAIATVSIAAAWKNDRRAAQAILAGLGAGIVLDLVTGLIQLPHWRANFDVNWIAQSGGAGALGAFAAAGAGLVTGNLIAVALLAVGLLSRRSNAALVVLAPIPLAILGWLILDAMTPMLVPRYLAGVTAILATAAAVGWWELNLKLPIDAGLAMLAALQPLASSVARPPLPGWEVGAGIARSVLAGCPSAKVYAVSPWRFRDQPDSKTAQFENPVIGFAYAQVGHRFGLEPQFVTRPTTVALGHCPAIVWIEGGHGIEAYAPAVILRHAQLSLLGPARVLTLPTPNGAVLLLFPADRLERRR